LERIRIPVYKQLIWEKRYEHVRWIVSWKSFEHYRVNDLSLYILVNRQHVTDMDGYANRIIREVTVALKDIPLQRWISEIRKSQWTYVRWSINICS
jgi:hypothetical protein